jgi:DNA polymerase III subunit epsilon
MELVIFDLETTGLSPMGDEIIQIAAVRVSGGAVRPTEAFATYVHPGRRIPSFIAQYTGVTDVHVRSAPRIGEALAAFARFAGNGTLVAHNGRRFDIPFIRAACQKTALPTRPVDCADSIDLSRRVWAGVRGHGLDAVIERLGLDTRAFRRHDARGDVGILAEAVTRMCRRLQPPVPEPADVASKLPIPLFRGVLPV